MEKEMTTNSTQNNGHQTITTGTLSERAMLISLSVSLWTARKLDKKVTSEVAVQHGTSETVGRYNKKLLPQNAPSYEAIVSAGSSARNDHYLHTLPWANDGARILPAANFFEYSERMRQHKARFETALEEFLGDYPQFVQNARDVLNGLWNAADYPSDRDLRRRFQFSTTVMPMPSAEDFRVDLGDEHVMRLRREIERHTEQAVKVAVSDAWQRLHTALEKMRERLEQPDAIYRDSLFGNLAELCEILPRLNLTQDPKLDEMTEQIKKRVLVCQPETARTDKDTRARIAAEVARIEQSVAGCFVSLEE